MNASATLHAAVLAACFASHFAFAGEFCGMRRALETLKPVSAGVVVAEETTSA